jgi:YD repeat-containing protein
MHIFRDDAAGNTSLSVDPRGAQFNGTWDPLYQTDYTYDAFNRLATVTEPDSDYDPIALTNGPDGRPVWQYTYDAAGNQISLIDSLNRMTKTTYDAIGLVASDSQYAQSTDTTPQATTSYTYDDRANLVKVVDPVGITTRYQYDLIDRPTVTDGQDVVVNGVTQSHISSMEYDLTGNVTATVDELGRRTTMQYDGLNRLVAVNSPSLAGQPTRDISIYDRSGNVIRSIDPLGLVTKFSYDNANRQTSTTDPKGQTTTTTYDALGNVLNVVDPQLVKTSYEYDQLNRVVKEGIRTGTSGGNDVNSNRLYEYDVDGNLTKSSLKITLRRKCDYPKRRRS